MLHQRNLTVNLIQCHLPSRFIPRFQLCGCEGFHHSVVAHRRSHFLLDPFGSFRMAFCLLMSADRRLTKQVEWITSRQFFPNFV